LNRDWETRLIQEIPLEFSCALAAVQLLVERRLAGALEGFRLSGQIGSLAA